MRQRPELSIVVPIFNEEESVPLLYEKLCATCETNGWLYEIIFVDDGSCDNTFSILEQLHQKNPRVRVVRFRKNYGQTAAMAAGFRASRGTIVVSMDSDLQNDPSDIPALVAMLSEGYDVVCGWRKDRKDKLITRKIPSNVANWLISKITGVLIHDNGCSLRAYRSQVIKRLALYSELHRFIPAMSTLTGARVGEMVVRHHRRQFGRSKYGISRVWRVFLDLFLIDMLTSFSAKPALWFATLSLPGLTFGSLCLSGALIQGMNGVVLTTLAFLLFSLAGHCLAMGVLGEMVLRTGNFRPETMLVIRGMRGQGTALDVGQGVIGQMKEDPQSQS